MIPSAKDEKQLTADLVERHLFDHYKQLWHENAFIGRFHFSLERDAASVRLQRITGETQELASLQFSELFYVANVGWVLRMRVLSADGTQSQFTIGHVPAAFMNTNLFIWLPSMPDFRRAANGTATVNLCYKSRHDPGLCIEGNVYITRSTH